MPEPSEFIAVEQNINNGVESKYFAVSKGFLGGLWAVLFGLAIICAEVVGVEAWDFAHWYQWIKVVGATLGTLAAAYGLYGRCVATAPIRFS